MYEGCPVGILDQECQETQVGEQIRQSDCEQERPHRTNVKRESYADSCSDMPRGSVESLLSVVAILVLASLIRKFATGKKDKSGQKQRGGVA